MSVLANPENPAQLAAIRAERTSLTDVQFDISSREEFALAELDFAAESLGFIDSVYQVEAVRAFSIPVGWDDYKKVEYQNCMDVLFEGKFVSYGRVAIGEIVGYGSVRALCMAFDKVFTRQPYFEQIPEDHLFFTPILGVETIKKLRQAC